MGLLNSFQKKPTQASAKKTLSYSIGNIDTIIRDSDKVIAACQKADAEYNKDHDLDKRLAVYEKYFLKKPEWNGFNFCLSLATMYVKSGQNDKAWGYLNQLFIWTIEPGPINGYAYKVRYEQFKILKSEKRFKDAMVMLVSSNILNSEAMVKPYFNKDKFLKDAKTTAKGIGFSEDSLEEFANRLEKGIISKNLKDSTAQRFCSDYYNYIDV
ncbi:MAG: hypothetical protein IJ757_08900 [Clostridiales bacterium]|nr:hypothetical protein [Clostridiales bacterium]